MNTQVCNGITLCPHSWDAKHVGRNMKPTLIMLVGIPGSGKSHFAQNYVKENDRFVIISSDAIRAELFDDESDQSDNAKVFKVAHSRIKHYLQEGVSVVFDATNISKKRRAAFLAELKNIPCHKMAVAVMTPYEVCVQRNESRERSVPKSAIRKMYLNWEPPYIGEGFDETFFIYGCEVDLLEKYTLFNLINDSGSFMNLDQENSHHSRTLGMHCLSAAAYFMERLPHKPLLILAALLHDTGKAFTKSRLNHKGVEDGNCHYYQHHCVSAYDSLFYLRKVALSMHEKIYVSNLIFYHMHPHRNWKDSAKAVQRDKKIMGNDKDYTYDLYHDVKLLHHADCAAQ